MSLCVCFKHIANNIQSVYDYIHPSPTTDMLKMEGQGLQSMAQQQKYMSIRRKTLLKRCQSRLKVARGLK